MKVDIDDLSAQVFLVSAIHQYWFSHFILIGMIMMHSLLKNKNIAKMPRKGVKH